MQGSQHIFSRKEMLTRMYASDVAADGLFVTGVITTGIYCLPSCPARKPKTENVQFFVDEAGARAAGLRPCKRCKPDYYYAGHDPDLEKLIAAIEALKANPAAIKNVSALTNRVGVGQSKLYDLVQKHISTTPGELIHKCRIEYAILLMSSKGATVAEAAFEVGYESLSTFYDRFKEHKGVTPGAYRKAAS